MIVPLGFAQSRDLGAQVLPDVRDAICAQAAQHQLDVLTYQHYRNVLPVAAGPVSLGCFVGHRGPELEGWYYRSRAPGEPGRERP